jgi:hypothetical protein
MPTSSAEIIREYGPFPNAENVGGVTFDGEQVWFAAGGALRSFDPTSGDAGRTIDVAAHAGTAFDGRHLYQIAESRISKIDPATGEVLEQLEMPPGVNVSGLESDGGDRFFCGGGKSGKVRSVRRPKRGSAGGA